MPTTSDSKSARIWYIHGNLQLPKAWFCFDQTFQYQDQTGQSHYFESSFENLWQTKANSFTEWTIEFCDRVQSLAAQAPQFIIGYSLGGRLALHAILHKPELWTGAILIGAHPGLTSLEARGRCLVNDQKWGKRFLNEPWQNLLTEWDQLAIFGGYPNALPRLEREFDRNQVCKLFNTFSKGRQANLLPALSQMQYPPMLFISGEQDTKYCELGQTLEQCGLTITHVIIPQAAHRVPWENPPEFIRATQAFLNQQLQAPEPARELLAMT